MDMERAPEAISSDRAQRGQLIRKLCKNLGRQLLQRPEAGTFGAQRSNDDFWFAAEGTGSRQTRMCRGQIRKDYIPEYISAQ